MQKKLRLRSAKDFARLRASGQNRRHPLCILVYAPNGFDYNRYGVITSKQLGNAVARNRIRRRLRATLHRLHPQLRQGYDVLVIARHAIVEQTYSRIHHTLSTLLTQAGLLITTP